MRYIPMKPQSAKAKGRLLQKHVIKRLIDVLGIDPEDIENRSMGAGGEDIILSLAARRAFPFSVECKNQESVNIWNAYKQAEENSRMGEPLVVLKRNKHKPLALVDFEFLLELISINAALSSIRVSVKKK